MEIESQSPYLEIHENSQTGSTPQSLLAEHPLTSSLIAEVQGTGAALRFGSLLLNPEYQPNCIRLEALIHLSMVAGSGKENLSPATAKKCFDDLGEGSCGISEDPIEDVFVSLVFTEMGNFRVLGGIWESGSFYLQRCLEVLSTAPDGDLFESLRTGVSAVLQLSEEVCKRFAVERNTVGARYPKQHLIADDIANENWKQLVFTKAELDQLGIAKASLKDFVLTKSWQDRLSQFPVGNSPLQQLPLIEVGDGVGFVLPTATTFAIRMLLCQRLIEGGFGVSLTQQLGNAYVSLLRSTPIFRLPREYPISFAGTPLKTIDCVQEFDAGRYLHILLVLDDLQNIRKTGVAGTNHSMSINSNTVYDSAKHAYSSVKNTTGFRGGLTLIVTCGIGRGVAVPIPNLGTEWTVQVITAPDLVTLGWTRGFSLLKLWRTLEAFECLDRFGLKIMNINGLLNLIGWMKSNDWQVLPHAQVPKDMRHGGVVQLPTESLCELRAEVTTSTDRIGIWHPNKGFVSCRKLNESYFESENALPIYIQESVPPGNDFPFIYRSRQTDWWCVVNDRDGKWLYERWLTLQMWLPRIVTVLEHKLDSFPKTIDVSLTFLHSIEDAPELPIPSFPEIQNSIVVDEVNRELIRITVGPAFEFGMQATTNDSEAALVDTLCSAILGLTSTRVTQAEFELLRAQIIPDEHARHLHAFHARDFADHVASKLRELPIEIDETDSAALRIGLAFRVESRSNGRFATRSKRRSTDLLNAVASALEVELRDLTHLFDRKQLVEMALLNHERAVFMRKRWMNTAKANLSIRADSQESIDLITRKDMNLSSTIASSQIVAEIAISEAPLSGGIAAGQLDFTRMMSLINAIVEFRGWSDAIHLDAMSPNLAITATGDIHADNQFRREVLKPFSWKNSEQRLTTAVETYSNNYRPKQIAERETALESQFESAWKEELGVSLLDIRQFMDDIEDIGISRRDAVFTIKRSELLGSSKTQPEVIKQIIDHFSLRSRPASSTPPDGFDLKDVEFWRFRRQLSCVRRPILQLCDGPDPMLSVAPGFLRQCMWYVVKNYYEGTFPSRHYRTEAMKKWHGLRINQRGKAFTGAVADELRKYGWECWPEKKVSTLAHCGKNPDYGDVDVVAWHAGQRRLLLIECKHLYHGKTAGEIAEQLRDYRGLVRQDGRKQKKDDLRKHLDRLEILKDRRDTVCKTLEISSDARFEGWTIFKNPVPMLYCWKTFEDKIQIGTFSGIEEIANPCK